MMTDLELVAVAARGRGWTREDRVRALREIVANIVTNGLPEPELAGAVLAATVGLGLGARDARAALCAAAPLTA